MTFSPLYNQRTLNPNGPTDCFETCLLMVLTFLGHPTPAAAVLGVHSGATDIPTALSMCAHFGLKGVVATKAGFDNNDKLVIALFHDNNLADPDVSGQYQHYGLVYAQNSSSVFMANPWGVLSTGPGRDETIPLTQFNPAYIEGIEIPISINKAAPTTPPPAPPMGPLWIAQAPAILPDGRGYLMDGWGGLHAKGGAPSVTNAPYWKNWHIARDVALSPDCKVGLTLDGYGGVHAWTTDGSAKPAISATAYWPGWDIARRLVVINWNPLQGYVMDGYGGFHSFNGAKALVSPASDPGYWQGGVA